MSWVEDHWDEIVVMPLIAAPVRLCEVRGCDRERRAKGLCMNHYNLARQRFDGEYGDRARRLRREREAAARGGTPAEQTVFDAGTGLPATRGSSAGQTTGRPS